MPRGGRSQLGNRNDASVALQLLLVELGGFRTLISGFG
jgi:hypothetical protein